MRGQRAADSEFRVYPQVRTNCPIFFVLFRIIFLALKKRFTAYNYYPVINITSTRRPAFIPIALSRKNSKIPIVKDDQSIR